MSGKMGRERKMTEEIHLLQFRLSKINERCITKSLVQIKKLPDYKSLNGVR